MKKKIGLICICTMLIAGCGKIPKLENGQEAVVTFKDGDKISVDDLYNKMKDEYALNSLITMIDLQILEAEFEDYVETAESYAENHIKGMIESYEGEDNLLQALQNYGYSSIEAYQNYIYLSYMQNHAIEEYAKLQVTDKDIEKYYNNKAQGDVEISHILITADVTDEMTKDEVTKAEEKAKNQIKDIIKELKDAKDVTKKFAELVKEYSEDDDTKEKSGALGKITYGDLDANYDELLDAAYKIKDGEVYGEVITTELGYHVIMRTKSYEKESLKDLKDEIRNILSEDLLENDSDISIQALQYYREENEVAIQDSKLKQQYEKYMQNLISQYNSAE